MVILFGLTLYFVRRARRRWSAPAEIPSGGIPGQSAPGKSPSPGPNRSSHASSNGRYRQSGRSQKQGPSNRKEPEQLGALQPAERGIDRDPQALHHSTPTHGDRLEAGGAIGVEVLLEDGYGKDVG